MVSKLDRLPFSMRDLLLPELAGGLGVTLLSLTEPLNTRTAAARTFFHMPGALLSSKEP